MDVKGEIEFIQSFVSRLTPARRVLSRSTPVITAVDVPMNQQIRIDQRNSKNSDFKKHTLTLKSQKPQNDDDDELLAP